MRPVLLRSAFKDYLWGGEKLKKLYGAGGDRIAEAWLLSCHINGESTVSGVPLSVFIKENDAFAGADKILIKLIDAADDLSLQVHPDDAYASGFGESGKTECWYIIDCEEGAQIVFGLGKTCGREEISSLINNGDILSVCRRIRVKKGDCFFIEPGTLHSIGKGILLAEVQQSNDLTFRVYDYGRKDKNGKCRELHIEKALDVMDYSPSRLSEPSASGNTLTFPENDYFDASVVNLNGEYSAFNETQIISATVLSGECLMSADNETVALNAGSTILIPKACSASFVGSASLLIASPK